MFFVKDLISAKRDENEKIVSIVNDWLIDINNNINRKEIPENENPKNVVSIIEKISALWNNKKLGELKY